MMDEEILDFKSVLRFQIEKMRTGRARERVCVAALANVLLQTVLVERRRPPRCSMPRARTVCLQAWWVTLFGLDSVAVSAQALVASLWEERHRPRARAPPTAL